MRGDVTLPQADWGDFAATLTRNRAQGRCGRQRGKSKARCRRFRCHVDTESGTGALWLSTRQERSPISPISLTQNRPPTGEIRKCAGDGPDGIMRKRSPQTASLRLSLPMRKLPSPQANSRKRKSVCSVSTVTRFGMAITSRNWRTPRREPTPSMGVSILCIHRARATDSMTSRNQGSGKSNAAVNPQKTAQS